MKNLWLHGIYLSVIGVLSFQLWAKTVAHQTAHNTVMTEVEKNLKENNIVLRYVNDTYLADIEHNSVINPDKYSRFSNRAKIVFESSNSFTNVLAKNLFNLEKGEKANIKEIKDSLIECHQRLKSIVDEPDSILFKRSFILKVIENDTFWTDFQSNEKVYLTLLKNYILLDEQMLQNYIMDSFGCIRVEIKLDAYKVLIIPQKNQIFEGEEFKADVFIVNHIRPIKDDISFFNGTQKLIANDGLVQFSEIANTKGLKTVKIKAVIPNPDTQQNVYLQSEYQYNVLPKCSQNCQ